MTRHCSSGRAAAQWKLPLLSYSWFTCSCPAGFAVEDEGGAGARPNWGGGVTGAGKGWGRGSMER